MATTPTCDWTSRTTALLAVAVAVCALLAHASSLGNGFVSWDDTIFAPSADGIAVAPGHSTEILGRGSTKGLAFYPVFRASMQLDRLLWGGSPSGAHALNVALHAAVCVLAFLLLRRFGGVGSSAAFIAAMLLAVHPVASESVAWASGRKVLLAAAFSLGAFLCSLGSKPRSVRRLAAAVLFALACLSNAAAVGLPLVLIAHEIIAKRKRIGQALGARLGLVLIAVTAGVARAIMVPRGGERSAVLDLMVGAVESLAGLGRGIARLALPFHLSNIYPRGVLNGFDTGLAFALILLLVSAVVVLRLRGRPGVRFAVAWFWLMALPALGHHAGPGDRHMVLPSIGAFLLVGIVLAKVPRTRMALAAPVLVLLCLGVLSPAQDRVWRSSRSLWTHAVRVSPSSAVAHQQLGSALMRRGRLAAAMAQYQRVLAMTPDDPTVHYNVASLYSRLGNHAMAVEHLRTAVMLDPELAVAWNNLGQALERTGQRNEAAACYMKAMSLNIRLSRPGRNLARIHYARGNEFAAKGNTARAIEEYRQALNVDVGHTGAMVNLGNALAMTGRPQAAVRYFRDAIRFDPKLVEAYFNLSLALEAIGRRPEAVEVLTRGVNETGSDQLKQRLKQLSTGKGTP